MKLIVGLGNPGEKYELTRHNVGFEVIDLFRQRIVIESDAQYQHQAIIVKGRLRAEDLILAKPQTFMNLSGIAVAELVSSYGVSLQDLYVIYDDIDLELGVLRIRRGGSAGGHKGVKSIIDALGNQSFPRLRIGIGQPPPNIDAVDYVLSKFSAQEREIIEQSKLKAVEALNAMILEGIEPAMNKFNTRQTNKLGG